MIELQINTTQNVNITYKAASLGERMVAFLVDYIIIAAYAFFVFKMLNIFNFFTKEMDNWSRFATISLVLLPATLYSLISEYSMNGQTFGKKVMKIKVVKIDGYQASFVDFVIRWAFRLIDIFLMFGTGAIAILSIGFSKKSQRIGDFAAGTGVISLKDDTTISHTILEDVEGYYQVQYPSVINLSDRDMRIIKDTFRVATRNKDYKTLIKLRDKVQSITQTDRGTKTDEEYLRIIMKDYTHLTKDMV